MTFRLTVWEWIFLLIVALIAGGILLMATSVYGAGVTSDSIFYLSSADNFAKGVGLFDFKGDPLTDFPPLYSLILGSLSWISGVTPFVWGRLLNVAAMALLVMSTGWLMKGCFPERKAWFYLGSLIPALMTPLYALAANICTDVLFILFSLWFCISAQSWLGTRSREGLIAMTLLAAGAAMLRWVGLALVLTEFFVILLGPRSRWLHGLPRAVLFSGLAFLPVFSWELGRNRLLYGMMGTQRNLGNVDFFRNLELIFARIAQWISPMPTLYCWPFLVSFLVVALTLNRKADISRFLYRLRDNSMLSLFLLSIFYLFSVLLTGYTSDHLAEWDHRYQLPLYPVVLVLLFSGMDEFLLNHLERVWRGVVILLVAALVVIWGIYQGASINQFVQKSRARGVIVYNEYNTRRMIRSGLVVYLIKNPPPGERTLYSNEPEAVYFFLRRPVEMSPLDLAHYSADPQRLVTLYPHWPAEPEAYLIWFKPNMKRQYYTPDDLSQIAQMEKLYKRYDGEVYLVRPKE